VSSGFCPERREKSVGKTQIMLRKFHQKDLIIEKEEWRNGRRNHQLKLTKYRYQPPELPNSGEGTLSSFYANNCVCAFSIEAKK
jgi:hypothetical protein